MLSQDLDRYIVLQRACGLKFTTQPSLLRSFVACAEATGDTYVRADRVLDWAARTTSAAQARNRLAIVRRFAMALAIEDPGHEVPSSDAFGRWRFERRMPHIYTAEEIAALMAAARRLGRPGSIRPETMVTLIGLLAATGLRVSEALKLDVGDITADGLVIRETKFRKSRLVPLHSSARAALDRYLRRRRKVPGKGTSFFVGDSGRRPAYVTLYALFLRLGRETGLRGLPGEKGPRLHDLRHTFAVRSLESCDGDRRAISRHMLALATYMGHSDPSHTWWYIQATPTLMHHIAEAGEALLAGGSE
ncbi:MAG TPA: tyrosine-type recombinase/integrase [Egibacteraceae bacterium]|nr:tyrosine-type recombinase/integrase [Egibacteraceae bacterium]